MKAMHRRGVVVAAVLSLAVAFAGGWQAKKGKIVGEVVDASGKPVAGLVVRFHKPMDFGGSNPIPGGNAPSGNSTPVPVNLQKIGAKIGERTTDTNGRFELELPEGRVLYRYGSLDGAVKPKSGVVEVKAGETTTLKITLDK